MNIFIIPSWYPGNNSPIAGIFVKEQAEALAELYPENNFIISWTENFFLSISEINNSIIIFRRFRDAEARYRKIKENLFEFYNPVITWTGKLAGETKNIIKAQIINFLKAKELFGNIDLIHAHVSYPGGFAAMKLKEKFNVPYIVTEHMGPFPFEIYLKNGKLSDKISLPLQNADRIISVSNFSAGQIKLYGINAPVVIPNIVNENVFSPLSSEINKEKIKFLTVATLIETKGIEELMEGVLLSAGKSLRCEFKIAGAGHMDQYIQEFILKNDLKDKVKLIREPSRAEIVELFRRCDVFILPSHYESFGIVYIEAMACGKPVIATDCGGPSDFVNKENGLLLEVGNVDQISEAISFMAENINMYNPKVIREFFMNNFSRKVVCSKIVSVYKEIKNEKV